MKRYMHFCSHKESKLMNTPGNGKYVCNKILKKLVTYILCSIYVFNKVYWLPKEIKFEYVPGVLGLFTQKATIVVPKFFIV